MTASPVVSVVTVTFNSAAVLPDLLESVPAGVEAIVVDNHSGDASRELAAERGARVIALDKNVGFGRANNIGAREARGRFLLLVNPDVVLSRGAIDALLAAAAVHPGAAFNPRIVAGSKRQFRRWSWLIAKADYWRGPAPEADCEVPVLSGACIFIRKDIFERVGGFDENIFLYHEDDDLSLRLRQRGTVLFYIDDAVVTHHGGKSSERTAEVGALKGYEMARSLVYVMRKHQIPFNRDWERLKASLMLCAPHVSANPGRRAKYLGLLKGLSED
jgi:N-acetylglucosaminyl-diphospho-decaprenol L-rhamnosyltransferase